MFDILDVLIPRQLLLLNLLWWHLLIKWYRCQVYDSTIHHLYMCCVFTTAGQDSCLNPVHWILCLESDSHIDGSQILVMIFEAYYMCWNLFFMGFLKFSLLLTFYEVFYMCAFVYIYRKSMHIPGLYSSMSFHSLNTPVYPAPRSRNRALSA